MQITGTPFMGNRTGKVRRSSKMNIGRNTAIALSEPYFGSGRNLTVDNFFTDMALSTHLLANNMTLLETMRKNKRFLPNKFQSGEGLKKGDAIFGFPKKNHTIVAYKSNKKKHVVVMSTMHHGDSFDIECRKPEMVMSYNATNGGVDTMDQMCHALTTKRKTNIWPMLLFYNLLDLASIASLVAWRKLNPNDKVSGEDDRVLFNLATAKELVLPQLERRQALTNLSRNLRYTINTALEDERAQTQPAEEASVSTDSTATQKRDGKRETPDGSWAMGESKKKAEASGGAIFVFIHDSRNSVHCLPAWHGEGLWGRRGG
ncbi:PiggyBac transposable element-derived protein 4 [Elysia marginata]|uniref:PiggyBac transposable element-derived protein 4 n=1 Tax=Elysia marginata TaxID=1093978 RepID=A0AAV4EBI6_9GAST|nr:PiggyBac transposable element-derived protein 4 [Elysia marginata]